VAGLPHFRVHDLRHTFASHAVMAGIPLHVVQRWLGHSTPQLTMRYAHLSPEYQAERIELLDLALEKK
jgi:integrase